jgi:hypothetical protein
MKAISPVMTRINLVRRNQKDDHLSAYHEKGQSLVEFAFSLVILLILISGIVDLGRAFFTYMALHDAAQEGAIYGSLNPEDTSGIIQRVRQTSQQPVNLMDASIIEVPDPKFQNDSPCEGSVIEVTVIYRDFPLTMPFMSTLIGKQSLDMSATVKDMIVRSSCHQ